MCLYNIKVSKHEVDDFPVNELKINSFWADLLEDENTNPKRHPLRNKKQQHEVVKASTCGS